jgi:hypothetical protein
MTTQRNPEAVQKLAALVRELAATDQYRHLMYYSHLIATLQDFHDQLATLEKGTPEQRRVYAAATKIYNAARVYALEHAFDPPNTVMLSCGYDHSKL